MSQRNAWIVISLRVALLDGWFIYPRQIFSVFEDESKQVDSNIQVFYLLIGNLRNQDGRNDNCSCEKYYFLFSFSFLDHRQIFHFGNSRTEKGKSFSLEGKQRLSNFVVWRSRCPQIPKSELLWATATYQWRRRWEGGQPGTFQRAFFVFYNRPFYSSWKVTTLLHETEA